MKYMFVAPNLAYPTFETLRESSYVMFYKIETLLKKINESQVTFRISVTKEGRVFKVTVEIIGLKDFTPVVHIKSPNLRLAVSESSHKIKEQILKFKDKKVA